MILLLAVLQALDGWKAVQDAVDRGEAARAELVKSADFYAQAALAQIDTLAAVKAKPVPRSKAAEGPARDVGAALFESAGLGVLGLPEDRVALPAGLPFWEAASEIARQLGGDFEQVSFFAWRFARPASPKPLFASGRVHARVDSLRLWSRYDLGVPAMRTAKFSGRLGAFFDFQEPVLGRAARVLEAVDDRGRALSGRGSMHEAQGVACAGLFTASLALPDDAASKLARLRLACDFRLPAAEETVEITGFVGARDLRKTFGEVDVTVVRAGKEDKHFVLALRFQAPDLDGRFRGDELVLSDARGRRWTRAGGKGIPESGGLAIMYEFSPPEPDAVPTRISLKLVTRTKVRSVFLEFRDLPLQ